MVFLHQTGVTGPYERVGGSEGMLADEVAYVVGVDTHRDQHVLAVVAAPAGGVVAQRSVAARRPRLRASLALRQRVRGRRACLGGPWKGGVEGGEQDVA
jgi:hypothetical protein